MSNSLRSFSLRKILLALIGTLLLAFAVFGAWTFWPLRGATTIVGAAQPAANEPAKTLPIKEPIVVTVTKATPVAEQKELPKPEQVRKKEPPRGKDHDRQETMLAKVMQQVHLEAYEQFIHAPGNGRNREL